MHIDKSKIRTIILEELDLMLKEDEVSEIKSFVPWLLAGAAALGSGEATAAQKKPAATAKQNASLIFKYIDGIGISKHAVEDAGGVQNIKMIKEMVNKANKELYRHYSSPEVIDKYKKTYEITTETPENFSKNLFDKLSSEEEESGFPKIMILSPRDLKKMEKAHGKYFPTIHSIAINPLSIKKFGEGIYSVIKHETQHKTMHYVGEIHNFDFMNNPHPPFRDYTIQDLTPTQESFLKDEESSAYSYMFRDAFNLNHVTTVDEIVNAFKEKNVNLQNIKDNIYIVKDIGEYPIYNQIFFSLRRQLGDELATQVYKAMLPFQVKVNIGGKEYIGIDLQKLSNNLSKFAVVNTQQNSKFA